MMLLQTLAVEPLFEGNPEVFSFENQLIELEMNTNILVYFNLVF